ncbi:MAG TPA: hypothetical protein VIS49_00315 [Cyclobacteriaceae bacterium]
MKKLIAMTALMAFAVTVSFAQSDYRQMEAVNMRVKPDKVDLFKKGMAAHNKKYHSADPYKAAVRMQITGPNAGSYVWVMGPTTWTQMDGRPGKGEHDTDWEKNVAAYCDYISPPAYWRWVKDVSYDAAPGKNTMMSRARFNEVRPGQMDRFVELMKRVAATNKHVKSSMSFSVAIRQDWARGVNVISFSGFDKWAQLEGNPNFSKGYEELYGEGSWDRFLEEIDMCVDRSMTYESISELLPDLGG